MPRTGLMILDKCQKKNYFNLTTHITVRKYSYLFCVNKNIHIYYRHRHTRDGFRNLITGFTPSKYYCIPQNVSMRLLNVQNYYLRHKSKVKIKNTNLEVGYTVKRLIYKI